METTPTPGMLLLKKINEARDDQVVDVSNIDYTGGHIPYAPKPKTMDRESKGVRKMVSGLNIVSDNYAHYKAAVDMLGPDYQHFADEYADYFGKGQMSRGSASTKAAKKVEGEAFVEAVNKVIISNNAGNTPKVVDVSNLGTDGKGFRTVDDPFVKSPNYSGNKKRVEGLPIISNSVDTYLKAMDYLGMDYLDYGTAFAEAFPDLEKRSPGRAGSPKKGGPKSPGKDASASEKLKYQYILALENGMNLDVSNVDFNTGLGSRKSKKSVRPTGSITRFSGGHPVLISNNLQGFINAIDLLGENADFIIAFEDQTIGLPKDRDGHFIRPAGKAKVSPKGTIAKKGELRAYPRTSPARKVSPRRGSPLRVSPLRVSPIRLSASPRRLSASPIRVSASPRRVSPRVSPRRVSPRVSPRRSAAGLLPLPSRRNI